MMGVPQLGALHHKGVATQCLLGKAVARVADPSQDLYLPRQPNGTTRQVSRITAQDHGVPMHSSLVWHLHQQGPLGQCLHNKAPMDLILIPALMSQLAVPVGAHLGPLSDR